jgi:hypothetical protein
VNFVNPDTDNEIIFQGDQFWIVRRRKVFGPFDYQWSGDLYGIELTYQGHKFGEICGDEQIFADLKPFKLPLAVARVAALTAGAVVFGIRAGTCQEERIRHLISLLQQFGFEQFRIRDSRSAAG